MSVCEAKIRPGTVIAPKGASSQTTSEIRRYSTASTLAGVITVR
jgi:hypothetical protein